MSFYTKDTTGEIQRASFKNDQVKRIFHGSFHKVNFALCICLSLCNQFSLSWRRKDIRIWSVWPLLKSFSWLKLLLTLTLSQSIKKQRKGVSPKITFTRIYTPIKKPFSGRGHWKMLDHGCVYLTVTSENMRGWAEVLLSSLIFLNSVSGSLRLPVKVHHRGNSCGLNGRCSGLFVVVLPPRILGWTQ